MGSCPHGAQSIGKDNYKKKLCLLGLGLAANALSPKQFCQGGGPDSVVRTQVSSVFDPTLLGLNLKMQEASFTLQEEMKK